MIRPEILMSRERTGFPDGSKFGRPLIQSRWYRVIRGEAMELCRGYCSSNQKCLRLLPGVAAGATQTTEVVGCFHEEIDTDEGAKKRKR